MLNIHPWSHGLFFPGEKKQNSKADLPIGYKKQEGENFHENGEIQLSRKSQTIEWLIPQ